MADELEEDEKIPALTRLKKQLKELAAYKRLGAGPEQLEDIILEEKREAEHWAARYNAAGSSTDEINIIDSEYRSIIHTRYNVMIQEIAQRKAQQGSTQGPSSGQSSSGQPEPAHVCGDAGKEWIPDYILDVPFRNACQKHDDCYEAFGVNKFDCDTAFLENLMNEVEKIYPMDKRLWNPIYAAKAIQARIAASAYFYAVVLFAQKNYDVSQEDTETDKIGQVTPRFKKLLPSLEVSSSRKYIPNEPMEAVSTGVENDKGIYPSWLKKSIVENLKFGVVSVSYSTGSESTVPLPTIEYGSGDIIAVEENLLNIMEKFAVNPEQASLELAREIQTEYQFEMPERPDSNDSIGYNVIKIQEDESGRNLEFMDVTTGMKMDRQDFIKLIRDGKYPRYHVRVIEGIETPVSNPNKDHEDNLG